MLPHTPVFNTKPGKKNSYYCNVIPRYKLKTNMKFPKHLCAFAIVAFAVSSCVPARQFEEVKAKQKKCEEESATLRTQNQEFSTKLTELNTQLSEVQRRRSSLEQDTSSIGKSLRAITRNYDKLNDTYELLLQKNKELLAGNAEETKKLSGNLQLTQEELQKKQDELKLMEQQLNQKKADLEATNAELKKREARVAELEEVLKNKDQAVSELKKKVADALLGFVNNGLTVEQKNGKVYVSLEERLLFASGSIVVDPKGAEALKKLAKVLEQNQDINVLVEGHTDNVPYASSSGSIKDNWDLSVLRATSIVKILLSGSKLEPSRLTAAGRGEFMPLDKANTPEARKKNRRTEIILTPKLDELLKVLESQ